MIPWNTSILVGCTRRLRRRLVVIACCCVMAGGMPWLIPGLGLWTSLIRWGGSVSRPFRLRGFGLLSR